MARGNPNWGKQDATTWRFRVRGENRDGDMVTLGNYEQEAEAEARRQELVKEGYYRQLQIEAVEPPPVEADLEDDASSESE